MMCSPWSGSLSIASHGYPQHVDEKRCQQDKQLCQGHLVGVEGSAEGGGQVFPLG